MTGRATYIYLASTPTVWEIRISKKGLALATQQVEDSSPSFSNSLKSHWGLLLGRGLSIALLQTRNLLGHVTMASVSGLWLQISVLVLVFLMVIV